MVSNDGALSVESLLRIVILILAGCTGAKGPGADSDSACASGCVLMAPKTRNILADSGKRHQNWRFSPHLARKLPQAGRPSDGRGDAVQEVEAQVPKRVEARVAARAS